MQDRFLSFPARPIAATLSYLAVPPPRPRQLNAPRPRVFHDSLRQTSLPIDTNTENIAADTHSQCGVSLTGVDSALADYRTKLSRLRKNILPTRDLPALLNGKYWTASDAERDEYINERGIQERERTLGCKTGMQMGRFRVQLSRACWAIFCRRERGSNFDLRSSTFASSPRASKAAQNPRAAIAPCGPLGLRIAVWRAPGGPTISPSRGD